MDITKQRVLVTGARGFLGGHIIDELRRCAVSTVLSPTHQECDLLLAEAVHSWFEENHPEVVIHAAGLVGGIGANISQPGRFFYENALMGMHLIEACRHFRVQKVVIIGTVCSYPEGASVPLREVDFWNGYPEPTNAPYGIAKRGLLAQCRAYRSQYNLHSVYLLPTNLYGPRDHFGSDASHVIPAIIHKCIDARIRGLPEITLWGTGAATRDFLYVTDAAAAIVTAAQAYDDATPMNIGSGSDISIHSVAQKIAYLTQFDGKIKWDASKPDGQRRRLLDITRAQRILGFSPRVSLEVGLRSTIDWLSDQIRNHENR